MLDIVGSGRALPPARASWRACNSREWITRRVRKAMSAAGRAPFDLGISARLMVTFAAVATLPALVLTYWLAINADAQAATLVWSSLGVSAAAAILAVFVGRVVTYHLDRAFWQVLRAARRLAAGDFSHLVQVESTPEFRELSGALERVGVRLEALQSALDRLEVRSGFELGRRSSEMESLQSQTRRLQAEADVLHRFEIAISRTVDPAQICSELVAHAEGQLDYVWAVVYLVDSASGKLVPVFVADRSRKLRQVGHHLKELRGLFDLGEKSSAAWAVQTGRALRIGEGQDDRWRHVLQDGLRSMLVVPITAKDEVLGAVELAHSKPGVYTDREEQFLATLAAQAGMAIENARLLEEAAKVEAYRELDRLKSELLSTVSHELRTPLVSIKGYAETLLREDVTWSEDERREFLRCIDEESDRLRSLIDDLLQMSQIEAGKLRISQQRVVLSRLAQRVARKARHQTQNHSISVSFPGDLPPVDADPKRVEQVLTNLIQNAIKYSPRGGAIKIRGLAATARPGGGFDFPGDRPSHVVVAVADEGVGIPPEHRERIFDRFYRVDGKLARETGGSGLGLAICKGLVEAHGGSIWVESPGVLVRAGEAGTGSTFYFSLPVRDPSADELEAVGVGGEDAALDEDE